MPRRAAAGTRLVETVVREPHAADAAAAPCAGDAADAPTGLAAHRRRGPAAPAASASTSSTASSAAGSCPGSLVLVGGEPGIGKSTLLLQAAAGLARHRAGRPVLYATGEESPGQVRLRAARLGLLDGPSARAASGSSPSTTSGGSSRSPAPSGRRWSSSTRSRPRRSTSSTGAAGSVGQVREATLRLMDLAKGDGIAVILVGHVTKDGSIAGPKTLEHLVDAVINLEGERYAALRLLRATKNRFGSTDEVGVFEMAETGLLEVADPARAFLADHGGVGAGQRRRADPRGQPAAARRGPGAGQPDRLRHARRARRAASTRTG